MQRVCVLVLANKKRAGDNWKSTEGVGMKHSFQWRSPSSCTTEDIPLCSYQDLIRQINGFAIFLRRHVPETKAGRGLTKHIKPVAKLHWRMSFPHAKLDRQHLGLGIANVYGVRSGHGRRHSHTEPKEAPRISGPGVFLQSDFCWAGRIVCPLFINKMLRGFVPRYFFDQRYLGPTHDSTAHAMIWQRVGVVHAVFFILSSCSDDCRPSSLSCQHCPCIS